MPHVFLTVSAVYCRTPQAVSVEQTVAVKDAGLTGKLNRKYEKHTH